MRLGIIECGRHRPELQARFGPYSAMFKRWLGQTAPEVDFRVFDILQGDWPEAPGHCDAWLIGGSPSGVYDGDPWIDQLSAFVQRVYREKSPLIGVCFGHQIIAQALGGRVEKSPKGWGVGVHEYSLQSRPTWMTPEAPVLRLRAMHQDQIVQRPSEATTFAASPFCPHAGLVYGDPERPKAVSFQPHPEFEADFAATLIKLRMEDSIPPETGEAALKSLEASPETPQVMNQEAALWIAEFLRISATQRSAA